MRGSLSSPLIASSTRRRTSRSLDGNISLYSQLIGAAPPLRMNSRARDRQRKWGRRTQKLKSIHSTSRGNLPTPRAFRTEPARALAKVIYLVPCPRRKHSKWVARRCLRRCSRRTWNTAQPLDRRRHALNMHAYTFNKFISHTFQTAFYVNARQEEHMLARDTPYLRT